MTEVVHVSFGMSVYALLCSSQVFVRRPAGRCYGRTFRSSLKSKSPREASCRRFWTGTLERIVGLENWKK